MERDELFRIAREIAQEEERDVVWDKDGKLVYADGAELGEDVKARINQAFLAKHLGGNKACAHN